MLRRGGSCSFQAKRDSRRRQTGIRAIESPAIKGEGPMPDHEERPPSTLAHGAVQSGDIERVRRDVDKSEAHVAHDQKTIAARKEEAIRRKNSSEEDADT